jgi:hypothetical protein
MNRINRGAFIKNANLKHCLVFLRNGGERVRAIRLVVDVLGLKPKMAIKFVDELRFNTTITNKPKCWICGERVKDDSDGELIPRQVVVTKPEGGQVCAPHVKRAHKECWDMRNGTA